MILVYIIIIALIFDFINGFHDSANSIATVVSTRVLKPHQAVIMAAFANFIAAFFFTTSVATTIGKGTIDPGAIDLQTVLAGLIAACTWNIITWRLGLPTSSSHTLIGGLIGAAIIKGGLSVIVVKGITKTLIFIFVAPTLGMMSAILFTILVLAIIRNRSNNASKKAFSSLQIFSSFMYSLGHGGNDAQKTMGVITLTLYTKQLLEKNADIPIWVILSCHAAIGLGTLFGGWKIVKTMGTKIIDLKPFEGFCAESTSAIILFLTSHFGIPVSTTQVIAGSIMGVGTVRGFKKVRWITTRKIIIAWLLTIPVSMLIGGLTNFIFILVKF